LSCHLQLNLAVGLASLQDGIFERSLVVAYGNLGATRVLVSLQSMVTIDKERTLPEP